MKIPTPIPISQHFKQNVATVGKHGKTLTATASMSLFPLPERKKKQMQRKGMNEHDRVDTRSFKQTHVSSGREMDRIQVLLNKFMASFIYCSAIAQLQ